MAIPLPLPVLIASSSAKIYFFTSQIVSFFHPRLSNHFVVNTHLFCSSKYHIMRLTSSSYPGGFHSITVFSSWSSIIGCVHTRIILLYISKNCVFPILYFLYPCIFSYTCCSWSHGLRPKKL